MKLLHYTYRKLSLLLLLLMAAWGVLFYYAIIDEVMDETDDTLENYSEISKAKMRMNRCGYLKQFSACRTDSIMNWS